MARTHNTLVIHVCNYCISPLHLSFAFICQNAQEMYCSSGHIICGERSISDCYSSHKHAMLNGPVSSVPTVHTIKDKVFVQCTMNHGSHIECLPTWKAKLTCLCCFVGRVPIYGWGLLCRCSKDPVTHIESGHYNPGKVYVCIYHYNFAQICIIEIKQLLVIFNILRNLFPPTHEHIVILPHSQ